jgi:hypothetical protein
MKHKLLRRRRQHVEAADGTEGGPPARRDPLAATDGAEVGKDRDRDRDRGAPVRFAAIPSAAEALLPRRRAEARPANSSVLLTSPYAINLSGSNVR